MELHTIVLESAAEATQVRALANDDDPETTISTALELKLRRLGFIHRTKIAPTLLKKGQALIDSPAFTQEDLTAALEKLQQIEVSPNSNEIDQILGNIGDLVMRVMLQSNLELEHRRKKLPPLPLPYHPDGRIGEFLEQFEGDATKQSRLANIIGPFFSIMRRISIALQSDTTNKIVLALEADEDDDDDENKESKKRRAKAIDSHHWGIVKGCLENLDTLTGDPECPKFKLVDISFLGDIIHKLSYSKNATDVLFYILKYAMTGEVNMLLNAPDARIDVYERMRKTPKSRSALVKFQEAIMNALEHMAPKIPFAGNRLEQKLNESDTFKKRKKEKRARKKRSVIELLHARGSAFMEFQRELEASGKDAVLFLNTEDEHSQKIIKALLGFMDSQKLKRDPFFERLMKQPIVMLGQKPLERDVLSNETQHNVRHFQFPDNAFPRQLSRIIGTTDEERELMEFADLLYAINNEVGTEGLHYPQQLYESAKVAYAIENPTKDDMLRYFFETCPSLSLSQIQDVLAILFQHGFGQLQPDTVKILQQRFSIPDFAINRLQTMTNQYHPDVLTNLDYETIDVLSCPQCFLAKDTTGFGVSEEADYITAALAKHDAVSIVDGTQYACPKEEDNIGDRIVYSLVEKIMAGDVPDELRNYSIVTFEATDELSKKLFAFFFGEEESKPALSEAEVRDIMILLKNYNDKIIFVVNSKKFDGKETAFEAQVRRIIRFFNEYDLKVVVVSPKAIPGMPSLHIPPVTEDNLCGRLKRERKNLECHFGLKIPEDVLIKLSKDIHRSRAVDQNPLDLALRTLEMAAMAADANEQDEISHTFVNQALASVFSQVDLERVRFLNPLIEGLPNVIRKHVFGQDRVVDELKRSIKEHLAGLRDTRKPLALLLPGPTGVGKTLICDVLQRHLGFPVLKIDGSQYKEEHSISRLVGSPPGYVGREDGVLSDFLKKHSIGVVFFDEIDKMHPDVLQFIMNFVDLGEITSGGGIVHSRPAIIIMGATNAGADLLQPNMTQHDVQDTLSIAFADSRGRKRPELVGRWTSVLPMLGVDEKAFRDAIHAELQGINTRPGMLALNIEIVEIDKSVIDFIFGECREVCLWKKQQARMGFMSKNIASGPRQMYYNLRQITDYVNRSIHLADIAGSADGLQKKRVALKVENGAVVAMELN